MMYRIRNWLVATLLLLCTPVGAATLSDIQVSNGNQQARITLSFIGDPDYAFSHQSKRTVALDIKQTGVIQGLPLLFSGNNLVKAIRSGTPKDAQTLRLVVDLTENGKTEAVKRQNGSNYTVVFTINADVPPPPPPPPVPSLHAARGIAIAHATSPQTKKSKRLLSFFILVLQDFLIRKTRKIDYFDLSFPLYLVAERRRFAAATHLGRQ